jgi:hypothetical protein
MKTILLILLAVAASPINVSAAVIFGPVLYRQASDSPFYAGIQSGDIQLEDFEDQRLSIPGVSVIVNRILLAAGVDADDGLLDGVGYNYAWGGGRFMDINFASDPSKGHPRYVGMALLGYSDLPPEIAGTKFYEAYDSLGFSITGEVRIPAVSRPAGTSEYWTGGDQFMGLYSESGISRIRVLARGFDHLQVGWSIPEPGVTCMAMAALVACFNCRKRITAVGL